MAEANEVQTTEQNSTVAIYGSMTEAEDAIRRLDEGGFPIGQISIVGQNLESERQIHGFVTTGKGAGIGAWMGGIFGILVGAAFVWVPGVGPLLVAGPLAAVLLGGVEGAAVGTGLGGLLGGLTGWGISRRHIPKYEDTIKGGNYLVVAHGSEEDASRARTLLEGTQAREVNTHTDGSDAEGSA